MKQKRISFDNFSVARMYEWFLALSQGQGKPCCDHCEVIAKKLAKFLGPTEARRLRQAVKKYPYFFDTESAKHPANRKQISKKKK